MFPALMSAEAKKAKEVHRKWNEETDIIIIGSGFAGHAAAIEASPGVTSVMTLEKM